MCNLVVAGGAYIKGNECATRELNAANPFDYLTELQKHAFELAKHRAAWMPWDYRATLQRPGTNGNSA